MDDWLVIVESIPLLLQHPEQLLQCSQDLGIVINWEKSDLEPSSRAQYLGMRIDTIQKSLHINILEMKVVVLVLNAFLATIVGKSIILKSDNATVITYLKEQGWDSDVRSGTGGHLVDRGSFGSSFGEVYSQEEHSGEPAESLRSGPSHRIIFLWCLMRSARSSVTLL